MNLQEIKNLKDQKGFTIVELLIVIVVIGILAAIVIVAFNGVQARANTSAAQSLATTIAKKAQAWNSIEGSVPTFTKLQRNESSASTTQNSGPQEARLDSTSQIQSGALGSATKDTVRYEYVSSSCAYVHYWDYTANATTTSGTNGKSFSVGC